MIVHFGVVDIPYAGRGAPAGSPEASGRRRTRGPKTVYVWTKVGWVEGTLGRRGVAPPKPPGQTQRGAAGVTTGDVAEWLEKKYSVMETFYTRHQEEVGRSLEESVRGQLENLLMGAPATANPFAQASSEIATSFKKFLSSGEIESAGIPGVPTKAALRGVNHRMKSRRGVRRPSFIDTGLYQSSATVWVE